MKVEIEILGNFRGDNDNFDYCKLKIGGGVGN